MRRGHDPALQILTHIFSNSLVGASIARPAGHCCVCTSVFRRIRRCFLCGRLITAPTDSIERFPNSLVGASIARPAGYCCVFTLDFRRIRRCFLCGRPMAAPTDSIERFPNSLVGASIARPAGHCCVFTLAFRRIRRYFLCGRLITAPTDSNVHLSNSFVGRIPYPPVPKPSPGGEGDTKCRVWGKHPTTFGLRRQLLPKEEP